LGHPISENPCFYNALTDRFENEETNSELAKIILINPSRPHILQYGGVIFNNINRQFFIYRDGKTTEILKNVYAHFFVPYAIIEYLPNQYLLFAEDSIRSYTNGKIQTKLGTNRKFIMSECLGDKVYLATARSLLVYQYNKTGDVQLVKEKTFPFDLRIFCKTGKRFAITSLNGTTYLLDKNSLDITAIVSATDGVPVRNVLEDKDDNIWLSSMDRGLIKVQQKRISSIDHPELRQNFNSLIKTKNIFAGNNNGEVYSYDGIYVKKLQFNNDKNIDTWVRTIIDTKYGIYVATQSASFLVNEKH
jgi:hypothetical protein